MSPKDVKEKCENALINGTSEIVPQHIKTNYVSGILMFRQ